MRRTKIVCTIGPSTFEYDDLFKLAKEGMNVARLNMSHGDKNWHKTAIERIKKINNESDSSVAIMIDTKGPVIRSSVLKKDLVMKRGDEVVFTTDEEQSEAEGVIGVNYSQFIEDAQIGDVILVDGGMLTFRVKEKREKILIGECVDGGTFTSNRHLNIRGRSIGLPSITVSDWEDIKFGLNHDIDFISLSFIKDDKSIKELRQYLDKEKKKVDIIAKIESADAIGNIEKIVDAADGVMIARGDLGSEFPIEEVPILQDKILQLSKKKGKPVIVATQILESMITSPIPTRAEVSDIAVAIRSGADAVMLSGETATGAYPHKAIEILAQVSKRIEQSVFSSQKVKERLPSSQEIVRSAALIGNRLDADAIIVFTRRGEFGKLISQTRPLSPIFAFTDTSHAKRRLNLDWGIKSFRIDFSKDPERTIQTAIEKLQSRSLLKSGSSVVIVSNILIEGELIETIQFRKIK